MSDHEDDKFKVIIFDKKDKFYVLFFEKTLLICSLDKGHEGQLIKKYSLDTITYEKICDVNFISDEPEDDHGHDHDHDHSTSIHPKAATHSHKHHPHKFKCMIACKVTAI